MFTQPVTWVNHWSSNIFSFKCTKPIGFTFTAGEFVLIGLVIDDAKIIRPYSIVSPPAAKELEFLSVAVTGGELTSHLQKIVPDDMIILYKKTTGTLINTALIPATDLWMLATGTGLAPFMSLIRDKDTQQIWDKIHIVHSVRNIEDLAYHDFLQQRIDLCTYHPIVTGQGHKRIGADVMSALGFDGKNHRIMLCGNEIFNTEMSVWCESQGMQEGSIKSAGTYVREKAFIDRNNLKFNYQK